MIPEAHVDQADITYVNKSVTEMVHPSKKLQEHVMFTIKTSKSVVPLTPLTLIYDSVTLPIMCKCMYRKSSRNITCNTALNGQGNLLLKADYRQEILASVTRL